MIITLRLCRLFDKLKLNAPNTKTKTKSRLPFRLCDETDDVRTAHSEIDNLPLLNVRNI